MTQPQSLLDVDAISALSIELGGLFATKVAHPFLAAAGSFGKVEDPAADLMAAAQSARAAFCKEMMIDDDIPEIVRHTSLRQAIEIFGINANNAINVFTKSDAYKEIETANLKIAQDYDVAHPMAKKMENMDAVILRLYEFRRDLDKKSRNAFLKDNKAVLDQDQKRSIFILMIDEVMSMGRQLVRGAMSEVEVSQKATPESRHDIELTGDIFVSSELLGDERVMLKIGERRGGHPTVVDKISSSMGGA